MDEGQSRIDHPALTPESQRLWERNARWWDAQVGEGNLFQSYLIGPATERLLGAVAGPIR